MALPNLRAIFASYRSPLEERQASNAAFYNIARPSCSTSAQPNTLKYNVKCILTSAPVTSISALRYEIMSALRDVNAEPRRGIKLTCQTHHAAVTGSTFRSEKTSLHVRQGLQDGVQSGTRLR
ncbi:uncharacterized protein L969DRAFT_91736 [Mixia osmundae IAM 14324]|uniref:Uncharacterized protein n=1 Tax=Mixia osmundae (strain CBS 9802 / IAM 14324 / JCM 22182 / KY 12970) TaxID=764103 RepID=G7E0C9_MIXOS|nr:uncharacterized protein L969DRAFT_91736 [Mixia osmundae IAM 14324]KEI42281.1 hypothetical protein L969DRAFT_91736 [Mixia osmundae IAM 14324]GAA96289.1 hypothetical protein E5Q_02955 [Mixia osmundae IAM 14324]